MKSRTATLLETARHHLSQGLDALTGQDPTQDAMAPLRIAADNLRLAATGEAVDRAEPTHSDDLAVDNFAAAMKEKLAEARAKGRDGWDDPQRCEVGYLAALLVEQVESRDADPVDVANFAMFLFHRPGGREALQAYARGRYPQQLAD